MRRLTPPALLHKQLKSRCSAIANVLGSLNLDGDRKDGTLNLFKEQLHDRLLLGVRAGQQHSNAVEAEAITLLGLRGCWTWCRAGPDPRTPVGWPPAARPSLAESRSPP
jgi:hypothetical protein